VGGVYAKSRFPATAPIIVATGQQLGAASLLLLPTLAFPPTRTPTASVTGAVLALALASTAVGFALFYRLVARLGPTGALSVTFLVPVFGLTWGAVFLDEEVSWGTVVGLAIVLTSIALVTGAGQRATDSSGRAAGLLEPDTGRLQDSTAD
jgi:drug/metabolite transporter (DMT)-like permease